MLLKNKIRPRDIVTRKALENAAAVVAPPVVPPTARCICLLSRMNAASISIFMPWAKSSKKRRI